MRTPLALPPSEKRFSRPQIPLFSLDNVVCMHYTYLARLADCLAGWAGRNLLEGIGWHTKAAP